MVYQGDQAREEVWVQLSDGSCRWRQSAGEVLVQVLRVPAGLRASQLLVELQLYSLHGEGSQRRQYRLPPVSTDCPLSVQDIAQPLTVCRL